MKKLVGILVVLLAISVAFSATITLKPSIKGTLWGKTQLDKTGLTTDLGFTLKSLGFGASADVSDLTFSLTIDLVGGTVTLNSFTVENDKAAASWYASKSFGSDSGKGLGWFGYYGTTKSKTFVLNMKALGLQVATQEALLGGTDRIALYGSWDIFSMALQTGMAGLGWSGDLIAEATIKPFTGLTLKGGLEAKDLTGTPTFDYVIDFDYKMTLGLLTLNPYARYASTKGQWVGLKVGYGIGESVVLKINADVKYDIAASKLFSWIQVALSKKGIGWAGVKFWYDHSFLVGGTNEMKLGFLVKSDGWEIDPVSLAVFVGSGDFTTKNDNNKSGFGYDIVGNLLADVKDLSAYAEASLSLAMGGFKPTLSIDGGYYLLNGTKELNVVLGFPVFDLINFEASVAFFPAIDWYVKLFYNYSF